MKRWGIGGLVCLLVSAVFAGGGNIQELEESNQGLSDYKPMYALIGNDPILEAKIQLSFKYRFLSKGAFKSKWTAPFNQLFFAYTQKMFWDLEKNSAPYPNNYLDSYYSPELIYLNRNLCPGLWRSQFDLQLGYQHESNGRDGTDARNWERLYIQPTWVWGDEAAWQFVASPKMWAILATNEQNADIADYLGYGELQLKLGRKDGILLDMMLRKGMADWYGAVELNASYPIKVLNIHVYGQMFHGYGDALRIYNEEVTSFRLGIALFR